MTRLLTNAPRRLVAWSAFNWAIWASVLCVISSQFLGIVWDSAVTYRHILFGRSPLEPMMDLQGFNDEAYSDRSVVCIKEANSFKPKQLSKALADPTLSVRVADLSVVDGYRVVKRERMTFSPDIYASYVRLCDRLGLTLTAIQDSCTALGYNVTREGLRIVDDIKASARMLDIPSALPILILPF